MINSLKIGSFQIPSQMIFWKKRNISAIVPCVRLMPGHVLVIPNRQVNNFNDLELQEISDIGILTQFLTKGIEKHYQASSSTVFIHNFSQEDKESIQHAFVHIIPRKQKDFQQNDLIYQLLESYDSQFNKQFKKQFTSKSSEANRDIESQMLESKNHQQFLEQFEKEEEERKLNEMNRS